MLAAIAILAVLTVTFAVMGRGGSGDAQSLPPVTGSRGVAPAELGDLAPTGPAGGFGPDRLRFADVSGAVGLGGDTIDPARGNVGAFVGGASLGDFDADGIVDLFVTRVGSANRLYRGTAEGLFEDRTEVAGLGDEPGGASDGSAASVWADVDGDDDLDLFVGGVGEQADRLYLNGGSGSFTEESGARGLALHPVDDDTSPSGNYATMGAAFADWDRDGDVDLITTHWAPPVWDGVETYSTGDDTNLCEVQRAPTSGRSEADPAAPRSRLLENDGTGVFRDITDESGIDLRRVAAFTPVVADHNDDGWPDLFITGDFCTSRPYQNTGQGGFVDVTKQAGLGTDENAMGSVVEDLNHDGTLDWFVTSIAPGPNDVGCVAGQVTVGCSGNRLYLGRREGGFVDATDEFGVREAAWAWGAAGEDLDNDGRRDLVTVNGYADESSSATGPGNASAAAFFAVGAPAVWRGSPGGPWVDEAASVGLVADGQAKSVIPFDHDGDGALDLLIGNTTSPPQLISSDLTGGGHWLGLQLHDATAPNTRAIGARVRVRKSADRGEWIGEVRTGSGYQSSGPGTLHIGLGESDELDEVEVRWPDSDSFERYDVESVDTTIIIERDSGAG